MTSIEHEPSPQPQPPKEVEQRQEEVEIPVELGQSTGVQPKPAQITAQVTDPTGKPMMSSPATQTVTVSLPASQQQLTTWSKGSPTQALTWFAAFWLRMLKKALRFGWKVVGKPEEVQS